MHLCNNKTRKLSDLSKFWFHVDKLLSVHFYHTINTGTYIVLIFNHSNQNLDHSALGYNSFHPHWPYSDEVGKSHHWLTEQCSPWLSGAVPESSLAHIVCYTHLQWQFCHPSLIDCWVIAVWAWLTDGVLSSVPVPLQLRVITLVAYSLQEHGPDTFDYLPFLNVTLFLHSLSRFLLFCLSTWFLCCSRQTF